MKKIMTFSFSGIVLLFIVLLFTCTFTLSEGKQAVITQFGKIVRIIDEPGLHLKTPFIQKIRFIEKRLLSWDGYPEQIPTKEKTYIWVDTTARWKIVDPQVFIESVQNERGAKTRLDAVLDSATRDIISANYLVEAVRNSNKIFEDIKSLQIEYQKQEKEEKVLGLSEEVIGDIDKVELGREKLSLMIAEAARPELKKIGVDLVDVQLRRIEYVDDIKAKVYDRMVSERLRIAEKIRSTGKGERAKIEGKTERDLQEIEATAYRKVQEIKGKAEAKAHAIYAKAMNRGPDFYEFLRSLEAYENSLKDKTRFILSTQSDFFKIMRQGK